MSDNKETSIGTGNGFLSDASGNKSSGRLIKVIAFFIAMGIAVAGLTISAFSLFTVKSENMVMDAGTFVSLVIGLVGSFLTIALGAEITQKATNL